MSRQHSGPAAGEPDNAAPQPSLAISVVVGGTVGTRPWREAISTVIRRVNAQSTRFHSTLRLKVIYQIPGEVVRPDFAGVRTGLFSRRELRLIVQVAVPEEVMQDREAWVISSLRDAVAEAERFAIMEGLPDADLSGLKQLVDAVSASPG